MEENPNDAHSITLEESSKSENNSHPKSSHEKDPGQEIDEEEQDNLEIREAFNLFDKDGNGCVTASELRNFLSALGYNMTEAEIMDMMNKIDADGNGAIDYPEFLELTMKKLHVASDEDLARETFQAFDRTQKGHITVGDLKRILKILEQDFSDTEIHEMITEADFDNDGVVNADDFLKMMNIV